MKRFIQKRRKKVVYKNQGNTKTLDTIKLHCLHKSSKDYSRKGGATFQRIDLTAGGDFHTC